MKKKVVFVMITLLLVANLCACGESITKGSGVTIDELDEIIGKACIVTETEEGYDFSNQFDAKQTVSGTANKNKEIISIEMLNTAIYDMPYLEALTAEKVQRDMKNWENVAIGKLDVITYALNCAAIVRLLSPDAASTVIEYYNSVGESVGLDLLLKSIESDQTDNGWVYSFESIDDSTAAFSAKFVG